MADNSLKLLVGLGNPGAGYAGHRHNVGFMAIDAIAEHYRFPNFSKKFQGEMSEGVIPLPPRPIPLPQGGEGVNSLSSRGEKPARKTIETGEGRNAAQKIFLLKPLTFMNLSGESVGAVCRFYKIEPHEVAVFHDELDIPLGQVRVKQGGGSGGHNGIKSIDQHIGPDYWRIRLGIGHPGVKELVTGHVLSDFAREETPSVNKVLDELARSIVLLTAADPAAFAQQVNKPG